MILSDLTPGACGLYTIGFCVVRILYVAIFVCFFQGKPEMVTLQSLAFVQQQRRSTV